ncbi:hypothetical protein EVAR_84159_1 [Eumeta japonica]|uniref:Uncharacterized protein n=1 Tax=Eumeta variegata TaxID=151549 RepID=A0A4C2A8A8_EUMVA|nr:hypothetical protein EVAR_84159_1 [Eumeta japonica]
MLATAVSTPDICRGGAPSSLQSFLSRSRSRAFWSPVPPPECGGARLFEAKGEAAMRCNFSQTEVFTSCLYCATLLARPRLPSEGCYFTAARLAGSRFRGAPCDLEAGDCIGGRVLVKAEGMAGGTDPLRKTPTGATEAPSGVSVCLGISMLPSPASKGKVRVAGLASFSPPLPCLCQDAVSDLPPASAPLKGHLVPARHGLQVAGIKIGIWGCSSREPTPIYLTPPMVGFDTNLANFGSALALFACADKHLFAHLTHCPVPDSQVIFRGMGHEKSRFMHVDAAWKDESDDHKNKGIIDCF